MKKQIFITLLLIIICAGLMAQDQTTFKETALNIINESAFCALTSINEEGFPESRMMQTLPTEEDLIIWLGTKPNTQKIEQIKNNHHVSVYFIESQSTGYVNIQGIAEIVNDSLNKTKHWKEGWESFYPDRENDFVLIKITPLKFQIVSYAKGILSQETDWRAPEIILQ